MPNDTIVGTMEIHPSWEMATIIVNYLGDDNHNSQAQVFWRSGGLWRTGMILTRDDRETYLDYSGNVANNPWINTYRGLLIALTPNTDYEVEVRVTDSDSGGGIVSGAFRTYDADPPSQGNIYYLSPTGNDASDGLSEATPWRTPQHATKQVVLGDTVLVGPGTYNFGQLVLQRSGVEGNYITWRALDPNNKPTIIAPSRDGGRGVIQLGVSFNRFSGIKLVGEGAYQVVHVYGTARRNIFDNGEVTVGGTGGNYWNAGFSLNSPDINGLLVKRTIFHTNASGTNNGPFCIAHHNEGARGVAFCDNFIDANFGDVCNRGATFNDHYYRNTLVDINDDGFELEGPGVCCSAWGNTLSRGGYADIAFGECYHGPLYIFRNEIPSTHTSGGGCVFKEGSNSSGFVWVIHNSISPYRVDAIHSIYAGGDVLDNVVFLNNIMAHRGGGNNYCIEDYIGTAIFDSNLMFSPRSDPIKWPHPSYGPMTWQAWREYSGNEKNGKWGDPLFVDAANGDLRLQAGSPAIDAGIIIPGFNDADSPWPYQGIAPDLGAIESGMTGPPQAAFLVDHASGDVPLLIQFTNRSIGAIDSYHWDFGDGGVSSEREPSHRYEQAGIFEVSLTVTGPGGPDSAYMDIEVVQTYVLTIIAGAGGTTNPEPGQYVETGTVVLTALPDSDYRFIGWEENGSIISTNNPANVFMDGDRAITAVFEYVEPPPGEYVVTITSLGGGITSPTGEVTVIEGDTLVVNAYPMDGFKFSRWEGDVTGTQSQLSIIVNSNMSVVAVFIEKPSSAWPIVAGVGISVAVIGIVSHFVGRKKVA